MADRTGAASYAPIPAAGSVSMSSHQAYAPIPVVQDSWRPSGDADGGNAQEAWYSQMAAGKAMRFLEYQDKGYCGVESDSVYGAALALPQLARTAEWSLAYTGLAIRSYVYLVANILLQGFLLYMIRKAQSVLQKFEGQMNLCDFGARLVNCPGDANCIGPSGTEYTPARLYNWQMWSTRMFATDAFRSIFPDRIDDINQNMDPGEYGVESYYLRIISCGIFVLGLWPEIRSALDVAFLLYYVPTKAQPWMSYDVPNWHHNKEHMKSVHSWSELDLVTFKVAGMPASWKLVNVFTVLLPKLWLWLLTVDIGMVFLMETSQIPDMIINAVALAFILSIDEILVSALFPSSATYMLENMESFPLFDQSILEDDTDIDAYNKNLMDQQFSLLSPKLWQSFISGRVVGIVCVTMFFMAKHYTQHCVHLPDGSWVAEDLFLPLRDQLSLWSFLLGPFPYLADIETENSPTWHFISRVNTTSR